MAKVLVFLANGFEEIEALTVVDMLRREEILVDMVSMDEKAEVTGSHGITVTADTRIDIADFDGADMLVLPGGIPGTDYLMVNKLLEEQLKRFASQGKMIGAICAAPSVLGMHGLLQGKRVTCYPGYEEKLLGAEWVEEPVVRDANIITSRGAGTAIEFAAAIIEHFKGITSSRRLLEKIVYSK